MKQVCSQCQSTNFILTRVKFECRNCGFVHVGDHPNMYAIPWPDPEPDEPFLRFKCEDFDDNGAIGPVEPVGFSLGQPPTWLALADAEALAAEHGVPLHEE